MKIYRYGIIGVAFLLAVAIFFPAVAAAPSQSIWDKISVERGSTNILGGGDYVSIKTNGTSITVLYGTKENPNTVKILASMERYAGGINLYDKNGTLVGKKILRYRAFLGQSFNFIGEYRNVNNSKTLVKYVALRGQWHLSGMKITNISSNQTLINFTIAMKDVPYTMVRDNSSAGDGMVSEIAFHFHILVEMKEQKVEGFPWYSYQPGKGVHMIGRKNYTGTVVTYRIKYDKEIIGWDYTNSSNRIVVVNNLFWGISGNEKVIKFIIHRYGGARARIGEHVYGNSSLPHHRIFIAHGGRITFTEIGQWQRIGRFRWESNVTVDNQTRRAYYQILGGERIYRWFDKRAVALVVLNGALIYPVGNHIFQDPSIEVSEYYLNFGALPLPTAGVAMMGTIAIVAVFAALLIYRFKK